MSSISNGNVDLTIRDIESYPDKLKFLLDLITFNEIPKVVGSYAYTTHKYPSDVDVFERVTVDLLADEAASFYESQFKIIFGKLLINSKKKKKDLERTYKTTGTNIKNFLVGVN